MKHLLLFLFTLIIYFSASQAILANENSSGQLSHKEGQSLHNKSCQQCHDNSVYSRPNSIIFSLTALDKRVRFCESMAAAHWSEPQMKSVIHYLNQEFYHYKR